MSMSKIFYGKRGSGVNTAAHSFANETLCIYGKAAAGCTCRSCQTNHSSHPDLAVYNKPAYVVEDIAQMLDFCNKPPIISPQKVLVIENMGAITEESQNKLLKNIESNADLCVIGTVYDGTDVLKTIKSRTHSIFIHPFDKKEFLKKVPETQNGMLLFYMTSGCLGLVEEMQEQIPIYVKVLHAMESADGKELLTALSLVKEKDENAYSQAYRPYVPDLFSFMQKLITDWYMSLWLDCKSFFNPQIKSPDRYLEIAKISDTGRSLSMTEGIIFTKNDFFHMIASICNQLSFIHKEKENNHEQ